MNRLGTIRKYVRSLILQEYGATKWIIYQTEIEGIRPKHKAIDSAFSKAEADKKVETLEMKDPSGIYYADRETAIKLKHSFELN